MPRTNWSPTEIATARKLSTEGRNSTEIAAAIGRPASSVRRVLGSSEKGFPLPDLGGAVPKAVSADTIAPAYKPEVSAGQIGEPREVMGRVIKPRGFSVERVLVLPDTHRPFHDKSAWRLAMMAAKQFRPDRIIHLGDLWDFYAISFHPKSPDRKSNLEFEIADGIEALDEMGTMGASRLDITLGNHEFRWDRYLTANAPEMFNLLRFEEVVGFKKRGWNVTPYRKHLTVGKMHFTHEVGFCGKQAHTQSRQEFEGNCVIGHTHGLASETKGTLLGSSHVGIQLGWLGCKDSIDYAHQKRAASWQHAFGLAYHEVSTGNVHVMPTPIVQGRCIVEGKLLEAPAMRAAA